MFRFVFFSSNVHNSHQLVLIAKLSFLFEGNCGKIPYYKIQAQSALILSFLLSWCIMTWHCHVNFLYWSKKCKENDALYYCFKSVPLHEHWVQVENGVRKRLLSMFPFRRLFAKLYFLICLLLSHLGWHCIWKAKCVICSCNFGYSSN
jgi:hypothetical protein